MCEIYWEVRKSDEKRREKGLGSELNFENLKIIQDARVAEYHARSSLALARMHRIA